MWRALQYIEIFIHLAESSFSNKMCDFRYNSKHTSSLLSKLLLVNLVLLSQQYLEFALINDSL